MDRMLVLVESTLSFGSEQWASIASSYNAHLPTGWPERDNDSLRRKFMSLKNKRKPTGDPDCPAEVKRAKIGFRRIEARCAVSSLNDDDSDEVGVEEDREPGSEGSISAAEYGLEAFVGELDSSGVDTSTLESPTTAATVGGLGEGTTTPQRGAGGTTTTTGGVTSGTTSGGANEEGATTAPRGDDIAEARAPPGISSSRATSSTTTTLTASARAGLTPTQLAQLSRNLSRASEERVPSTSLLSQTAQRRIRLDKLMDKVAADALPGNHGAESNLLGLMVMMEERQAARETEARQEREEREAARETRERQFQLELARSQGARDAQNQQLMVLVMTKVFGAPPPSGSDE